jgi:type II secretory pathway component GspD/PulD (secretin)
VGRDEKTVMLGLAPEITQFIRWEYYNTDAEGNALEDAGATATVKLPITNENTLETVVLVESGETVVLGGMIESNVNEDVSQVPILGDIPIIGRLFQHRSTSNEPTHLLIFVTARVQTLGVVQD